jgi:uncharacterized protein
LQIAADSGADPLVVVLFSLFHDCMRRTDKRDPKHGPRAADFVRGERTLLRFLTPTQFEQLVYACANHTHEIHNSDTTIGTCYDADRLDLPRVGIVPNPRMLNTAYAKRLARRRE